MSVGARAMKYLTPAENAELNRLASNGMARKSVMPWAEKLSDSRKELSDLRRAFDRFEADKTHEIQRLERQFAEAREQAELQQQSAEVWRVQAETTTEPRH